MLACPRHPHARASRHTRQLTGRRGPSTMAVNPITHAPAAKHLELGAQEALDVKVDAPSARESRPWRFSPIELFNIRRKSSAGEGVPRCRV